MIILFIFSVNGQRRLDCMYTMLFVMIQITMWEGRLVERISADQPTYSCVIPDFNQTRFDEFIIMHLYTMFVIIVVCCCCFLSNHGFY